MVLDISYILCMEISSEVIESPIRYDFRPNITICRQINTKHASIKYNGQ